MTDHGTDDAEDEPADRTLDRLLRAHHRVELVLTEVATGEIGPCIREPGEDQGEQHEAWALAIGDIAAEEHERTQAGAEVERPEGACSDAEGGRLNIAEAHEHEERRGDG